MRLQIFIPGYQIGYNGQPPLPSDDLQKMIVGMATIISRHQDHLSEIMWWNGNINFMVDTWDEAQAIGKAAKALGCTVSMSLEF